MKMHRLLLGLSLSLSFIPSLTNPVFAAPTTTTATTTTSTAEGNSNNQAVLADTRTEGHSLEGTYESAMVKEVKTTTQTNPNGGQQVRTYVIQYLSGPLKGKTADLSSDVSSNPYALDPRPGDKVLIFLQADPNGGEPHAFLESFDRRNAIYTLIALFVLTMVLLAGWQGLKVAASIFISVMLIGFVLIPSFLKGLNPVPIALILIALFSGISSVFAMGWNRKSLVTVIGTVGGTLTAYLIASIFADWAHLNGLSTEEDRLFFDKNPTLNPRGLLFAGIIIASMGIVEDVAVSIASGIMEVRQANPRLTFKELFRSGMIVGRDHMSALANTLIFAYVGASISTLLLYTQYGGSWGKFLNFDSVVDEIIRALAGTIGLVFTVPITALLGAWFALKSTRGRLDPVKEASGYRPKDMAP